jgi:phytoene synthase
MSGGIHKETFKRGSKTYFNSSVFFPRSVREDVYKLYGFVRVADDYVDAVPQDAAGFFAFKERYSAAMGGRPSGDPIIDSFVELLRRKDFKPEWVDGFLRSMEFDLTKSNYDTLDEALEYIYGSAEVIGLFMARLLNLPEESYHSAMMQGRAMQYINFIRDLNEDRGFGRRYLPLAGSGLDALDPDTARKNPDVFRRFIREQVSIYEGWQREAEQGYPLIPRRYLIPVRTASDMYNWTARTIAADPFVVFERKVKPARSKIYLRIFLNSLPGGMS